MRFWWILSVASILLAYAALTMNPGGLRTFKLATDDGELVSVHCLGSRPSNYGAPTPPLGAQHLVSPAGTAEADVLNVVWTPVRPRVGAGDGPSVNVTEACFLRYQHLKESQLRYFGAAVALAAASFVMNVLDRRAQRGLGT